MGSDDGTIGRVLTRREALALLGAGGLAALGAGRPATAAPAGACVVRPALTEGPYFFSDLEHTSADDEQTAIDAGRIRATGLRYIGVRR